MTAPDDIVVRDLATEDLEVVSRVHMNAFGDSVLAQLGEEAVRRNYAWQLDGPHDLTAVLAERRGEGVGYLFGGVFRGSTIGFVKREKWFLARRVALRPQILLRGVGWNRVMLAGRLLLRRHSAPQPEDPSRVPERSFGVLAIAVDPAAQGSGVGARLMDEARRSALAAGFERMHLSVHPGNDQAVRFYRNLGWTEMPDADGHWAGRMTIMLDRHE